VHVITRRKVMLDVAERFEIDVTTSGLYPARVQAHILEYSEGSDRVSVNGLKIKADGSVGQMYLDAHLDKHWRDDFSGIPLEVRTALGIEQP
jgi:hypothetical protein